MTSTNAPDTSGWTTINVALPLPLDVAATLMTLIGTAYPSAVVSTAFDSRYALTMKIDPAERAKKITKKQVAELKATRDDSIDDTDFLGFNETDDSTWVSLATPNELGLSLGAIAHEMFTKTEGAINYVEWEVHTAPDEDGHSERYVLCIAKAKDRTPGSLLAEAKKRIEELEALLAANGAA